MPALPIGAVTFLFTDIEGSTRMLRDVGNVVYSGVLADHHAILREAIAKAGGTEFGTEGDAFFVVFTDVAAAVAAAEVAQHALHGHDWPDGAEVMVRMGIHTGEGVLSDGDYVGLDVHFVARVASAGHGGQVLMSAAAAAALDEARLSGTELEDLGDHRLKDLGSQHLWQLRIAGLPVEPLSRRVEIVPSVWS